MYRQTKTSIRDRCELIRCKVTPLICSKGSVYFHPKKAKGSAINRSLDVGAFPLFFVQAYRKEYKNKRMNKQKNEYKNAYNIFFVQ